MGTESRSCPYPQWYHSLVSRIERTMSHRLWILALVTLISSTCLAAEQCTAIDSAGIREMKLLDKERCIYMGTVENSGTPAVIIFSSHTSPPDLLSFCHEIYGDEGGKNIVKRGSVTLDSTTDDEFTSTDNTYLLVIIGLVSLGVLLSLANFIIFLYAMCQKPDVDTVTALGGKQH